MTITKRYEERRVGSGRYARSVGGMTFGKLESLRSEFKSQKQTEKKLGAKNGLVGERSDLVAQFEGSKHHRTPARQVGDSQWLKVKGERIAVVVVGYELAEYLSSDTAEDMGHYDHKSGYYGLLFFRRATREEFDALAARDPREDAVAPESPQPVRTQVKGFKLWTEQRQDGWHVVDEQTSLSGPFPTEQRALSMVESITNTAGT